MAGNPDCAAVDLNSWPWNIEVLMPPADPDPRRDRRDVAAQLPPQAKRPIKACRPDFITPLLHALL
jgi:hypothetical protein